MKSFETIVDNLFECLVPCSFKKKGNNLYIKINQNYGIVSFQKSTYSTKETIKFTINIGIYSKVLSELQMNYFHSKKIFYIFLLHLF